MPRKITTQDFIEKAKGIHGDKYDYSLVEYILAKKNVKIICPDHGEFEQAPSNHYAGKGCHECGRLKIYDSLSLGRDKFIQKAKLKHGDKYDYSMVNFVNVETIIDIRCKQHGIFKQRSANHLKGHGCKWCGGRGLLTNEMFKQKAKEVHGDKYNYPNTTYTRSTKKVVITCKKHGDFEQIPSSHLQGVGCPTCGTDSSADKQRLTTPQFIEKATTIHGDEYDYEMVDYINAHTKVKIICKKHDEFEQTPIAHLQGQGCPSCVHQISKQEQEIADFIKSKGITVLQSDRTILNGLELDIVLPDFKIAIEYNGVYHHSEEFRPDKNYHRNKTLGCEEQGYRLIHIWSDDYMMNKERELDFISDQLGLNKTVDAKDCEVKFIDKEHVELYHDDELVSCTSFTNRGKKGYELVRHVSKGCVGSLGKATKYFVKNVSDKVYTFCDIARCTGEYYEKAGFEKVGEIEPNYKYVVDGVRKQTMEEEGAHRIWDCGKIRYAIIKI